MYFNIRRGLLVRLELDSTDWTESSQLVRPFELIPDHCTNKEKESHS